jgi:hypothetical protein
MPGLASVAREFEPRGVQFYALTVWGDDQAKVADWMRRLEVSGVQSGSADDEGAQKLHTLVKRPLRGIPSTVFVAADGTIRNVMGPADEAGFRRAFSALLE